jgi:hypothetical protein
LEFISWCFFFAAKIKCGVRAQKLIVFPKAIYGTNQMKVIRHLIRRSNDFSGQVSTSRNNNGSPDSSELKLESQEQHRNQNNVALSTVEAVSPKMQPPTFKLNTGASIPAVGLGTWQSKPAELEDANPLLPPS